MKRRIVTIAGVAVAASALTIGQAAAASAGFYGTVENNTDYSFTGAEFGEGSSSCSIWNKDGNSTYSPITWTCAKFGIAAHSTTGTWKDVDGFIPNYSSGYYVRFGSGSWKWVNSGIYTRIQDNHRATCYQSSVGIVNCTVSG